ncbi:MAG: ABC transporter permease [Gammaproteobacteria bacterium]
MLLFGRFVGIRFIMAIITLLMVTFIVFSLMELSPVNCLGRFQAINEHYVTRWANWVTDVFVHGDFGVSCLGDSSFGQMRINTLLGNKFWMSLGICLSSLLLAYLIAIPLGIYSATTSNRVINNFLRVFSYLGLAIPNFLLALMIILASTILYGNTPSGMLSREYQGVAWSYDKFVNFLSHAWIPVLVLGWSATAFALQTVRALMSDEYGKLYVTAARARGLSGQQLLWRYPARHALGPIINSLGFDLNRVFNELPIVALILTLTEAGALLLEALLRSNDQPLAAAILFLLTASIIGLNLFTDIILAILDPRFRHGILGKER